MHMGRLFWKIFVGFWLTVILVSAATALWFTLQRLRPPQDIVIEEMAARTSMAVVRSAALALAVGGQDTLAQWQETLSPTQRRNFSVEAAGFDKVPVPALAASDAVALDRHEVLAPQASIRATAPDGRTYALKYRETVEGLPYSDDHGPPAQLVISCLLGSLAFAALLAWYVTSPIRRLSRAFDRLAAGDMSVRTAPSLGRRRDELADLSRDFDQMAERIQGLVDARERLLHNVSHELRSPLARLHVAVDLARLDPAKTETSLTRIEREAQRLNALVGELLTLSRIEHGSLRLDAHVDLAALCAAVVEDAGYEGSMSGKRIHMTTMPPAAPPPELMLGSPELLRRAIENVVRNALHVSPQGVPVEVLFTHDLAANAYTIMVSDRGPGVPPESLGAMFEPFVQAHDGKREGFGLGLAIAARAVAAHGGAMAAVNRAGGGLTVTIRLPMNR
ncbi:ATP-binding protein [Pandoraea terrigena]|uniref:histidine kinase n=1 Tax=Pandoraea terrigena TaxID=2508292 RepID=A0A5E4XN97_9BURK|nr:ATP-binding protein [Pandoraea terrigena]VVE37981.1 ATPase [Pandoraea terrigena]